MLQKLWFVPPPITTQADENLAAFSPVLRQLLFNRGYATDADARAFLAAEPNFDTSPSQLGGMEVAVERIRFAIEHDEEIAVYGDYDVDGVTATALLLEALQHMGARVRPYIPSRFEEGYGLNSGALDSLRAEESASS